MTNRLEIPEELRQLIEKRENEERRGSDRRSEAATGEGLSSVPPEPVEEAASPEPGVERRSQRDRRKSQRRNK